MRTSTGTLLGTQSWEPVKIGGLGYVTGLDIASDGSWMIARTDVGGAYRREHTADEWTQIISSDYMTIPAPASPLGLGHNYGVYEAKIAPSNVSRAYMFFRGRCLRSSDRGVTWVDDGLNGSTGLTFNANGGAVRLRPDKLAIDTVNAEVAYFGSPANGLWRRLNGSWSQIAGVPVATTAVQAILIAVNATSSNTGSGATLRKSEVFASVNGAGVYRSTDGGSTFALMAGHPGAGSTYAASCMVIDQTGKLWLCLDNAASQNVWTWNGAWTQATMPNGNVRFLAVDPKNALRIVGCVGGGTQPFTSVNGGSTWASGFQPTNQWAAGDGVPLITSVLQATFTASQSAAASQFLPHPTENRDYIAMGLGVCYFDSPWSPKGSRTLVWNEYSPGIEELVARTALITPNGDTICASWDKAIIRQAEEGYAPSCYPPYQLTEGYSADYAIDNADYIAAIAVKGGNRSGYSTDGGQTWAQFTSSPTSRQGGALAVGNQGNIVYFPGQNGQPKYTTDNGVTWSTPTFTGWTLPADGTGNGFQFGSTEQYRQIVCADKNNPGTYYCFNSGAADSKGIWKSTNSGATWTRICTTSPIGDVYSGYHVHLKQAPNGDMFLNTGSVNTVFDNTTNAVLAKSINGGVTWANVPQLSEVNVFAIGDAAPDSATPYTLYAIAWKAGVFGLYRSIDGGTNWTALHNNPHFDSAQAMAADPNEFGRIIVGYTGTGFYESDYDYTLRLKAA